MAECFEQWLLSAKSEGSKGCEFKAHHENYY